MKELSIEEKAKAYDEALEKAKEYDPDLVGLSAGEILEDIFPELAESEDERIRKRIIALVNSHGQGMYKDEMLAWLEKQGEQKPWSEKDGRMLQNILDCLRNGYTKLPSDILQIESWLKSLKDRCLPQPKQEWSEKDENIIRDIIRFLDKLISYYRNKENDSEMVKHALISAIEKKKDWLKSLRPQKQWKPSDEQMKALYEETQKSDRIRDVRIVSLYEDLKKLMEE